MSDPIDRAQALDLLENEQRQANARLPDLEPVYERDCTACGNRIDPRRLKAWPAAIRCIGCEELHVQRDRFMGRPRA
jgi:RNA polymerase-binding transcription factor DksA